METNIQEIWKDIPGYEGYYQLSNLSRFKTLERWAVGQRKRDSIPIRILRPEKIMKLGKGDRYMIITLTKYNIKKTFIFHRLLAQLFIPNPLNLPQVNHINGNSFDNKLENLEWVTAMENCGHAVINKKRRSSKYVGVRFVEENIFRPWLARIIINGERLCLGYFKTEDEAGQSIQDALIENNLTNKYSK